MNALPTFRLKTRAITFDDRLQQVRIVKYNRPGAKPSQIRFLSYRDDAGFRYLQKYRKDWAKAIRF